MLAWLHIYSDILQNAPFRSQIFKIFFASGGKGALTPLTKIVRTFLVLRVLLAFKTLEITYSVKI